MDFRRYLTNGSYEVGRLVKEFPLLAAFTAWGIYSAGKSAYRCQFGEAGANLAIGFVGGLVLEGFRQSESDLRRDWREMKELERWMRRRNL
jgi:hypothetical protein